MKRALGASRRYARALLDVVLEQKGDAGGLRTELQDAARLLKGSRELQQALDHPAVPTEKKHALLAAVTKGSSELTQRLLKMLLERRRLLAMPEIARHYGALYNEQRGVVEADLASATPLTAAETKALLAALEKASGRKVELVARIDPELLGGVLVNMDGRTYDGTVKGRLQGLREHLAADGR